MKCIISACMHGILMHCMHCRLHACILIFLHDIEISVARVAYQLETLNPRKSGGPDEIPPQFLKELANDLAPNLSLIFQTSVRQGIVPDDWKRALVPVFKKGDRTNPSNYRPILLMCVVCKVLEHIITSSIYTHLESYNILCNGTLCATKEIHPVLDENVSAQESKTIRKSFSEECVKAIVEYITLI